MLREILTDRLIQECQLTNTLRSRAWQKSQHHQKRNVFSFMGGNSSEEKKKRSLLISSNNMSIVPLHHPITLIFTNYRDITKNRNNRMKKGIHITFPLLLTSRRELKLDEKPVDFLSACLLLNSSECLSEPVSSTFVPNLLWRKGPAEGKRRRLALLLIFR